LDDYARENDLKRIDLIKMDIEGAEWAALRGLSRILAESSPILLMEVNRAACSRSGYDPSVFWNYLCGDFGYTAWRIGTSASKWSQLPDADGIAQANVFFIRGELPTEIATDWDFQSCLRWAKSGCNRQ